MRRFAPIVILFAIVLGFVVDEQRSASNLSDQLRANCRRVNEGVRQPLYDFLVAGAAARKKAASEDPTSVAQQNDLRAYRSYKEIAQRMVAAAADEPLSKGSPAVDCQSAYPSPSFIPGL